MISKTLPLVLIAAAVAAGCSRDNSPEKSDAAESAGTAAPAATTSSAEPARPAAVTASAQLTAAQGQTVAGTLTITDEGDALRLTGALQGLAPNAEFGFHIHEKGDCSAADFSSAGAHFNPDNAQHGNPQGATRHAGDMLNAKSNAEGVANVDAILTTVSLGADAPNGVRGKAIVLHEKADDYTTQPSGNSGARIACGVIQ